MSECSAQSAGSGLHLDRTEVQRFEQSYEAWIQSMLQMVVPSAHVSILTEFNYSTNPDKIQNYEERRAAAHLPGLPDVSDMNDSHPTENPIYELVTQQNIKLIFDHPPSEDQARVLREVLTVKLNLDSAHGDQLSFDNINHGNISLSKNSKNNILIILLALLAATTLIVLISKRNSKKKELAEKEINALYEKIDPIASILNNDAKFLISFIRKQEIDFLVQIMAHAPVSFSQILLQVFEDEQRKQLFDAFQNQRLSISSKKSKYSQLLLAAKIHDELKIQAIQRVDELNEMSAKITEQRANMQQSLKQLKALYIEESVQLENSEEVNHEASI